MKKLLEVKLEQTNFKIETKRKNLKKKKFTKSKSKKMLKVPKEWVKAMEKNLGRKN